MPSVLIVNIDERLYICKDMRAGRLPRENGWLALNTLMVSDYSELPMLMSADGWDQIEPQVRFVRGPVKEYWDHHYTTKSE